MFKKDANNKTYPASLTKIMTKLIANIDDFSAVAPIDKAT